MMDEDRCVGAYRGSYVIIPSKWLVIEYHEGIGVVDDAKKSRKKLSADISYSSNYNVILDVRNLLIDASIKDVWLYIEFLLNNPKIAGVRRTAILTQTPQQVAIATLFQEHSRMLPQQVIVVSTIGAALHWVESEMSHHEYETLIEKMKRELDG